MTIFVKAFDRGALMVVLDELDHRIMEILHDNARVTNAELAQLAGSSEPTVRRRVDRLVKNEVIRIVAVTPPFQLGYEVIAILGLRIDHTHLSEIEAALAALPEIRFAGITLGTYDVLVEAWFHSNQELLAFLHEQVSRIPGIHHIESLQVAKMVKYTYDWGVGEIGRPGQTAADTGMSRRGEPAAASR